MVWYALQHRTVFEKLEFKYCNTGKSCVQSSELDAKSDINEIKLMIADHAGEMGSVLHYTSVCYQTQPTIALLRTFLTEIEQRFWSISELTDNCYNT